MSQSKQMKGLVKDTAIYGVSSILGRFLNWLLVPLYTYILTNSAEYGIVTNLYAWTAFLLVILTYGMETGFFRFANQDKTKVHIVYNTTLITNGVTSLLFVAFCLIYAQEIANLLGYAAHPEYIAMLASIVAMDAFGSIPFAYLRFKARPIKFAALKLLMVFTNIIFNVFFLVACPWLAEHAPDTIAWFYNPSYGVGYVFVANFISTAITTLALLPEIMAEKFSFDFSLLKKMLRYSLPLLVLGIAGIMNQTLDKILFPYLFDDPNFAKSELGIYGACFKVAMIMMMFTQAFRYAYEPFIFAQQKDKKSTEAYAQAMKFFIIFSLLIFLGMVFYLDIFKLIIRSDYWEGLRVVPIVLFSYIFQGVFFNLSLWYKLTDKTLYGAWLSVLGTIITVAINIIFVPKYSYIAAAWAAFACYFVIMVVSYFLGQKHMPIKYDLKSIGIYTAVALLLYFISLWVNFEFAVLNYLIKSVLLFAFLALIVKRDLPLTKMPFVNKIFARKYVG